MNCCGKLMSNGNWCLLPWGHAGEHIGSPDPWKMVKNTPEGFQVERRAQIRLPNGALTRVENITYTVLREREAQNDDEVPSGDEGQ